MSVSVKICGIMDPSALDAAIRAGTAYAGFVFYPPSRNAITASEAQHLTSQIPSHVTKVGLFVDAGDDEIRATLIQVPLNLLQLHGKETPQRVVALKALTKLPVMKALRLQTAEHLAAVAPFEVVADRLLFDSRIGDEPSGGPINWELLKGRGFAKPWMLAGGLKADNLAEAVRVSGAKIVDVSSGVEDGGYKSPRKIKEFIDLARNL